MPARNPLEIPELRDGVITAVRAQRNDPERVAVFIDGEFAFGLAAEIAVRAGLRRDLALSAADQARLLEDEQRARARRAALDYVAHRPRTETEVLRRLERRGFAGATALEAVDWLRGRAYLDDASYARDFVRERITRRGHGPARLRADLLRRGVDAHAIEAALTEFVDPDALRETAMELARARWARLSGESDVNKRRKKTADHLVRRGYASVLIREVVKAVEREARTPATS